MGNRFLFHSAVWILLRKEDKIVFLRRFNTGWMDGSYTVPSGHIEEGETELQAAAREAKEETGVVLSMDNVHVVHVCMRHNPDRTYFDVYVEADAWEGEPHNTEPEKSDNLSWFPVETLPESVLPNVRAVLDSIRQGKHYSSYGF